MLRCTWAAWRFNRLSIVYSTACSGCHQQIIPKLWITGPMLNPWMDSPLKGPVMRKSFLCYGTVTYRHNTLDSYTKIARYHPGNTSHHSNTINYTSPRRSGHIEVLANLRMKAIKMTLRGPLARYVKLRVVHAPGIPGKFSAPLRVSDTDMLHGTCVTGIANWRFPLKSVAGKTFAALPVHAQPTILRIC